MLSHVAPFSCLLVRLSGPLGFSRLLIALSCVGLASLGGAERAWAISANESAAHRRDPAQPAVGPKRKPQANGDPLEAGQGDLGQALKRAQKADEAARRSRSILSQANARLALAHAQSNAALLSASAPARKEAIATLREAIGLWEQVGDVRMVAMARDTLGGLLWALGQAVGDEAIYREGVAAHRKALDGFDRSNGPLEWAGMQMGLGLALSAVGDFDPSVRPDALEAYRRALSVYSPESAPWEWARTQHNLANLLQDLGAAQRNPRILGEAIEAYLSTRQVRRREVAPLQWANTQLGLASTRHQLARLHEAPGALGEHRQALTDVDAALAVATPDRALSSWVRSKTLRSEILTWIAYLEVDPDTGRQAVAEAAEAAARLDAAREPLSFRTARIRQGDAEHELGRVLDRAGRLREAADAFSRSAALRIETGALAASRISRAKEAEVLTRLITSRSGDGESAEAGSPKAPRSSGDSSEAALRLRAADALRAADEPELREKDPAAWRDGRAALTQKLDHLRKLATAIGPDADILARYANEAFSQALEAAATAQERNHLRAKRASFLLEEPPEGRVGVEAGLAEVDTLLHGPDKAALSLVERRDGLLLRAAASMRVAALSTRDRVSALKAEIMAKGDLRAAAALPFEGTPAERVALRLPIASAIAAAAVDTALTLPREDMLRDGAAIFIQAHDAGVMDDASASLFEDEGLIYAHLTAETGSASFFDQADEAFTRGLRAAEASGDPSQSEALLKQIANVRAVRALASLNRADLERAAATYETFLAKSEDNDPSLNQNLGLVLLQLGRMTNDPARFEAAGAAFRRASRLHTAQGRLRDADKASEQEKAALAAAPTSR
jgi:hypothetical protein